MERAVPKQSQTAQAFARVEVGLREEIAEAEAALAQAEETRASVDARLEELLRVRALIVGEAAAAGPARPTAKKAAKPRAKRATKRASRATGGLPEPGTTTRAVLDAVVAGARHYRDIRAQTGLTSRRIGGVIPGLVKRGLVVRVGDDDYAPGKDAG